MVVDGIASLLLIASIGTTVFMTIAPTFHAVWLFCGFLKYVVCGESAQQQTQAGDCTGPIPSKNSKDRTPGPQLALWRAIYFERNHAGERLDALAAATQRHLKGVDVKAEGAQGGRGPNK